jgi:hypothetical protein
MPNFSFLLSLDPMTAIIIVIVIGVSFAIVVGLRFVFQYSLIKEVKEAQKKSDDRISEIHTENEVNKTKIEWLTWLAKEESPLNKPSD